MSVPAVGASTYASGSHVWTGTSGTFTAKAARNARNSQRAVDSEIGSAASWRMSSVGWPSTAPARKARNRMARSRKADPAIV